MNGLLEIEGQDQHLVSEYLDYAGIELAYEEGVWFPLEGELVVDLIKTFS